MQENQLMYNFIEGKRRALLIELAEAERFLGITPTTAEIRKWHKDQIRTKSQNSPQKDLT